MPCCGLKLSLFCTLISVWGVIMLPILGLLLNTHSTAFAEDFEIEAEEKAHLKNAEALWEAVKEKYETAAVNCWIASGCYVVTLLISIHQFYYNIKNSSV